MSRNTQFHRQILINHTPYEKRIAILENNHLGEIFYEHPDGVVLLGSIYKGVVNAVLPGLQAAFVDLGHGKAGFLHAEDVGDRMHRLRSEYEDDEDAASSNTPASESSSINDLLKVGQELLVQVTKEPIGNKGPRLTTHISLPGRFLVCMPNTDFVGVSKKSRGFHRRRELKRLIRRLKAKGVGYIVRTLGLRESEEELAKQMEILESKWELCKQRAEQYEAPCLIFRESNFSETTLRDYFSQAVDQVIIDNREEYDSVINYLKVLSPEMVDRVNLYNGKQPIFDYYGLEEELEKTFESKVYLRRGGYLIIEQTEAMVSIDVNTGGKVLGKDQSKNIIETNIDAAWEIAKQMRLRDLGGLIVIDFIDMENEDDVQKVENEFKKAIRQDKAPIHFSLISQFGLMELTRKRVRPNLTRNRSNICPTCQGNRYIPKQEGVLAAIDRWFHRCHAKSDIREITLVLNPEMIEIITSDRACILKYWERKYDFILELMEDEAAHFINYRMFSTKTGDEITQLYSTSYTEETTESENLEELLD
jgi:ribonuclease G